MDVIEYVVLVDEQGRSTGRLPKAEAHHRDTPLHLAFSCFVFDEAGQVLVTRRGLTKQTFPGVWTNAVCGHPGPGERLEDAVQRRARDELGLRLRGLRLVLPRFRYTAVAEDGTLENELCPVLVAWADSALTPQADEVADVDWLPWDRFAAEVSDGTREVSVWCREEVEQLAALGPDPREWPAGDSKLLPAAARPA